MTIEIDSNFDSFINDMIYYAGQQGNALILKSNDPCWLNFDNEAEDFDPTDIPKLGKPFSRHVKDGINQVYTEKIKKGGNHADVMALNIQGEYLAAMERAYRFRHAGKIRRQAWAAARLAGQGLEYIKDNASGVFDRVRNQVNVTIESGNVDNYYSDPETDPFVNFMDAIVDSQNAAMGREEDEEDLLDQEEEDIPAEDEEDEPGDDVPGLGSCD